MGDDQFTEVTTQSWFSRLGGALKGIVVGLVLFVAAFPLLFWNEGRAVERYQSLKEGEGQVLQVGPAEVDTANEGRLVHVAGRADPTGEIFDTVFAVGGPFIKLQRTVEMYQWRETARSEEKKKLGGGTETVTTYSYEKSWSERPIDSAGFKQPQGHENPGGLPYTTARWTSEQVRLGAFALPEFLLQRIHHYTPLPVQAMDKLPEDLRGRAKLSNGAYYVGRDPASPRIGDLRIGYSVVKPMDISVVARQFGNTFEPYHTRAGGDIALLERGRRSADAMFVAAHEGNRLLTWILRGVGLLVMTLGLALVLKPLSVLGDVVPLIGDIVGAGTGLVAFLVSLVLAALTVAVAWLFYRPLIGAGLIALAVAAVVLLRRKLTGAKSARAAA